MHTKAKAREERDQAVRVSPLTGVIPPFSATQLIVSFHPPRAARATGFAAQAPDPAAADRAFDYTVQVDLTGQAGARALRFPVRGRGLLPRIGLEPRRLHFGGVECGRWGDQLVTVENGCEELGLEVEVDKGSPYFQVG